MSPIIVEIGPNFRTICVDWRESKLDVTLCCWSIVVVVVVVVE